MKKLAVIFAAALLSVIVFDLAVSKTSVTAEGTETGQESQEEHVFEEVDRLIRAGQTDEALRLLDEEEDHTSAEYYYLKEMAYLEDGSEEADEALQKLYPEAADQWPQWQHMQKMAGAAAVYAGNYESAEYRLFQALRLDMEDAETWYYLGALSYHQGNYEDMRTYFERALELGLGETKQQQILWYAEQAGDRE